MRKIYTNENIKAVAFMDCDFDRPMIIEYGNGDLHIETDNMVRLGKCELWRYEDVLVNVGKLMFDKDFPHRKITSAVLGPILNIYNFDKMIERIIAKHSKVDPNWINKVIIENRFGEVTTTFNMTKEGLVHILIYIDSIEIDNPITESAIVGVINMIGGVSTDSNKGETFSYKVSSNVTMPKHNAKMIKELEMNIHGMVESNELVSSIYLSELLKIRHEILVMIVSTILLFDIGKRNALEYEMGEQAFMLNRFTLLTLLSRLVKYGKNDNDIVRSRLMDKLVDILLDRKGIEEETKEETFDINLDYSYFDEMLDSCNLEKCDGMSEEIREWIEKDSNSILVHSWSITSIELNLDVLKYIHEKFVNKELDVLKIILKDIMSMDRENGIMVKDEEIIKVKTSNKQLKLLRKKPLL